MSEGLLVLTITYAMLDFITVVIMCCYLWGKHPKWAARYTLTAPISFPLTLPALALWGIPQCWRLAFPEPLLLGQRLLLTWHRWRDPRPAMGPTGEGVYRRVTDGKQEGEP